MVSGLVSCGRIDFEDADWLSGIDDTAPAGEDVSTDTSAGNNLFYSGPTITVPIAAADGERFIYGDSNALGIQGRWYSYQDDLSTLTMSNSVSGFFYLSGEVAPGEPAQYRYVGMGMGLCYDPETAYYPIGSCPWAPILAQQVVGFAFDFNGTYAESGGAVLIFISNSTGNSLHWDIPATGHHEVLFSDMRIAQPNVPLTASDIDRVQFQLGNQTAAAVPYDFFAGNFEILIRAQ